MSGVLVEVIRWVAKVTRSSDGGGVEDLRVRLRMSRTDVIWEDRSDLMRFEVNQWCALLRL